MSTGTSLAFERYFSLSLRGRVSYLQELVASRRIEQDFCIKALEWETEPLAQWFLIKATGVTKLRSALVHILRICENPDVEFAAGAGATSLHLIGAWAVGQIGESCTDSVLELLKDDQEQIRRFAVDALGQIGGAKPAVLEALGQALENDNQEVALWAALSLAKLGEPSLPILRRILVSKEVHRIGYALDAIIKIDGLQSHSILTQFLKNTDQELRGLYQRLIEQNENTLGDQRV